MNYSNISQWFSKFSKRILLALFVIFVVTFIFITYQLSRLENVGVSIASLPVQVFVTPVPYPLKVGSQPWPILSAKAAVVLDADSKKILFAKNERLRFSPASTVKIMTALVGMEYFKPEDMIMVKEEIWQLSTMYLRQGEKISFANILYGLLLNSGNDAALAVAENYQGGEREFIKRMNQKAKQLHLLDTYFVDAAGLDDDGNFITAFDLARLSAEAIENETLAKIFATKEKVVFDQTGKIAHSLHNLNKLLGINGVNGIKTGTSIGAGEVLVSSARHNGHTIIAVVLKSEDRFSDSSKLIDWVFNNFQFINFEELSRNHR